VGLLVRLEVPKRSTRPAQLCCGPQLCCLTDGVGLADRSDMAHRAPQTPPTEGPYFFFGASQASVTALSMTCRSTLLHRGHPNVRKSRPNELGSIAVNFIGELQVVHCGPWFCTSSMDFPSASAGALPNSRSPITAVVVR
jgi:hypothetical protein